MIRFTETDSRAVVAQAGDRGTVNVGVEFRFCKVKQILQMHRSDGDNNENILNATKVYWKMATMVHFMLCICYHNF